MSEEETGLVKGSDLSPSLGKGHLTQTGTNIVSKEPIEDLTMAGRMSEEVWFRRAVKQTVSRKRKILEVTIDYAVTDSDVEDAKEEFLEAFSKLEEAHEKVVAANGFDSDNSVDNSYMDEPTQDKITVMAVYKKWKEKRNADKKIAEDIENARL